MQFITLLAFTLPALAIPEAQVANGVPAAFEKVCEDRMAEYKAFCPQCAPACANVPSGNAYVECINKIYVAIQNEDTKCSNNNGIDCTGQAVKTVCNVD